MVRYNITHMHPGSLVFRNIPCLSILRSAKEEMYTCSEESTRGESGWGPPPPPTPEKILCRRESILQNHLLNYLAVTPEVLWLLGKQPQRRNGNKSKGNAENACALKVFRLRSCEPRRTSKQVPHHGNKFWERRRSPSRHCDGRI